MSIFLDATPITESVPGSYATVGEADAFLAKRIRMQSWNQADATDKQNALIEATSWIDRLNFAGDKTEDDQELEFPRSTDTVVPEDIKRACILIAKEMIEGRSPERQVDSVGKTNEGTMGTRDQFNRWYISDYIRAGITSAEAWGYLSPYLRDPKEMTLSRIS